MKQRDIKFSWWDATKRKKICASDVDLALKWLYAYALENDCKSFEIDKVWRFILKESGMRMKVRGSVNPETQFRYSILCLKE